MKLSVIKSITRQRLTIIKLLTDLVSFHLHLFTVNPNFSVALTYDLITVFMGVEMTGAQIPAEAV